MDLWFGAIYGLMGLCIVVGVWVVIWHHGDIIFVIAPAAAMMSMIPWLVRRKPRRKAP